jgi:Heparinase II/III N-terminus/Heparinase II/III-like protein
MYNSGMRAKLRLAWDVLRYLGPRWVSFRLRYAWRLRSGALERRSPLQSWAEIPAASHRLLLAKISQWPAAERWGDGCVHDAAEIARGTFVLFFHHRAPLGFPPDWRRNSFTGQVAPDGLHWSALGDFDFGDVKAIWEPSRFAWAFSLVRAYARTGDERHVDVFWRLFEDWCEKNPPNDGVNWKCGQESTFRLMAAAFAVAQFAKAPATTPKRIELWSRFVVATGRRIAANLDYALSQSNNHGVSESVGLLTASLLLAESDEARGWRRRSLPALRAQLDDLVYADGGFSQHSTVYHRVLVHDLLWAIVLLRAANEETPHWLLEKARQALAFLAPLVDPETGAAPLWGANDGSNILPLDECAYDDFRGVVQAGYAVLDGVRVLPAGPWDESAFWLIGKDPATLPLRPLDSPAHWHAAESGCFQWRSGDARLFMSCPMRFRHRVGHADMLHVDLWWRGQSVAHDAGSYCYNPTGPLDAAFVKAAAHNVPLLAGIEPLRQASRFLYVPWPRGTAGWSDDGRQFAATHDAYGSSARIERRITCPEKGVFVVTDVVVLSQPQAVRIHWLLADLAWKLDEAAGKLTAPLGEGQFTLSWQSSAKIRSATMTKAETGSACGWWSRHYLALEPAVSLELLFDVAKSLEVSARFRMHDVYAKTSRLGGTT